MDVTIKPGTFPISAIVGDDRLITNPMESERWYIQED